MMQNLLIFAQLNLKNAQPDRLAGLQIIIAIAFVFMLLGMACYWFIFEKAGEPGWQAIIPIYNFIVLMKVIGKPWWLVFFLLLSVIPFPGIIIALIITIIIVNALSKSFGKGDGFAIGLFFLSFIFLPILAFGDAKYVGPNGKRKKKKKVVEEEDEEEEFEEVEDE